MRLLHPIYHKSQFYPSPLHEINSMEFHSQLFEVYTRVVKKNEILRNTDKQQIDKMRWKMLSMSTIVMISSSVIRCSL
jgi:glycerol-3-phosphate O-acyltransferase